MQNSTEIVFYAAAARPEELQNLAFERIEWRAPQTLSELEFLPADRDLVAQLASGSLRIPDNWTAGANQMPAAPRENA